MRARTRSLHSAEYPMADDGSTDILARLRGFGHATSPQYRTRGGVRSGQASLGGAIALLAVPVLCILVLAAMGVGSAVGMATPRHHASEIAAAPVVADVSVASADAAGSQGWPQPSTAANADSANQPLESAKEAVAEAVAPGPSAEMNPISEPAANVPAAAASTPKSPGTITIVTFGYGFGDAPEGSAFVADVQNIDAGSFLKTETGLMPSVQVRVMATSAAQEWMRVFRAEWTPRLKDGDMVSIGCKRGHHRSVTLGVLFADELRAQGYTVNVVHRDILKSY